MRIFIFPTLLLCLFINNSFSQSNFSGLPNTYEYRYDEFNHIAIISDGFEGRYHLIILKNIATGRLDTLINNIGSSPIKIPYFGFIDSSHFVLIAETFRQPYPVRYVVYTMLPKGKEGYAEDIIINETPYHRDVVTGYADLSRKGRYDYRVIDLTHIEIYDRGRWIAVVDFDLKQKKLLRTEILLE
ncbi:MAG: hypothetical protein J0L99_09175 [Chitinophagales bacterium]|nr:hypothetical protein [Chitinophagales bacterium]